MRRGSPGRKSVLVHLTAHRYEQARLWSRGLLRGRTGPLPRSEAGGLVFHMSMGIFHCAPSFIHTTVEVPVSVTVSPLADCRVTRYVPTSTARSAEQ